MNNTTTTLRQNRPSTKAGSQPTDPALWSRLRLGLTILAALLTLALFPFFWQTWINWRYSPKMVAIENAPSGQVAIVFGARVYPSGALSAMLRDRVDTAVDLYHAGKVQKLIMSGDNRFEEYNEPGAMMAHAISRGVAPEDIQPDYGGRRTYDTCYRAGSIFQVESAILVTQAFHLPRALFVCESLGVSAIGVIADRRSYDPRSIAWSETREIPALLAALLDVIRRAPPPVLGDPIPIE
jgi:SanA protein